MVAKLENQLTEEQVIEAIYRCDGLMHYIAIDLCISRMSLYNYVDVHNLKHHVDAARKQLRISSAEIGAYGSQKLAQQLKAEPAVALKACMDAMDRFGKDLGFAKTEENTNEQVAVLIKLLQNQIGSPKMPEA